MYDRPRPRGCSECAAPAVSPSWPGSPGLFSRSIITSPLAPGEAAQERAEVERQRAEAAEAELARLRALLDERARQA
ncbi:MAG: hypothetical protein ACJ76Y_18435 [Thermoanaerobaculia bacterium]